ncbi:MAG: hypothetical protein AAF828_13045, partial [Bacteroidota bacterium]
FCLFLSFQLQAQLIPEGWEGKWTGNVTAWVYNEKIDSFTMSIDIVAQDSVWDFIIFYDRPVAGKPDIRPYQLMVVDTAKYHLAIDEKNSIVLDCFMNDNCLYDRFSGLGSDLQMRMCVEDSAMTYEITSYFSKPIRTSGNEVISGDTIPEIKSYELHYFMKAALRKE